MIEHNNKSNVFIYVLINPLDGKVFYVGCTRNAKQRRTSHRGGFSFINSHAVNIIDGIKGNCQEVEFLIIDTCSVDDASFYEEFYIDLYKSFGFELKQTRHSYYSQIFKNKKFAARELNPMKLIVNPDIVQSINSIASKTGLSTESLIRIAIGDFISKYENKHGIVLLPELLDKSYACKV